MFFIQTTENFHFIIDDNTGVEYDIFALDNIEEAEIKCKSLNRNLEELPAKIRSIEDDVKELNLKVFELRNYIQSVPKLEEYLITPTIRRLSQIEDDLNEYNLFN